MSQTQQTSARSLCAWTVTRLGWTLCMLAIATRPGYALPPAFTQAPEFVRDGERTVVRFAVNRATDVAVTI